MQELSDSADVLAEGSLMGPLERQRRLRWTERLQVTQPSLTTQVSQILTTCNRHDAYNACRQQTAAVMLSAVDRKAPSHLALLGGTDQPANVGACQALVILGHPGHDAAYNSVADYASSAQSHVPQLPPHAHHSCVHATMTLAHNLKYYECQSLAKVSWDCTAISQCCFEGLLLVESRASFCGN